MKIVTWNIKADIPFALVGWKKRKDLLRWEITALHADIYCFQEAKKNQLDFLMAGIPGYECVGVGREDGKEKGEYCPIVYNTETMRLVSGGTFWLSDTPDVPSSGYDTHPRICTWAIFNDGSDGEPIAIYNTHLPLVFHFAGKKKAVAALLDRIGQDRVRPIILTGDFNALPGSPVWQQIRRAGFLYGGDGRPTVHMFTVPTVCIDGIFTRGTLRTLLYNRIYTHQGMRYPSDHFGVAVTFERSQSHAQ